MNRKLTEQRQPTSPETDAALIWVELLAEIIVAALQKEDRDAHSSNEKGGVVRVLRIRLGRQMRGTRWPCGRCRGDDPPTEVHGGFRESDLAVEMPTIS